MKNFKNYVLALMTLMITAQVRSADDHMDVDGPEIRRQVDNEVNGPRFDYLDNAPAALEARIRERAAIEAANHNPVGNNRRNGNEDVQRLQNIQMDNQNVQRRIRGVKRKLNAGERCFDGVRGLEEAQSIYLDKVLEELAQIVSTRATQAKEVATKALAENKRLRQENANLEYQKQLLMSATKEAIQYVDQTKKLVQNDVIKNQSLQNKFTDLEQKNTRFECQVGHFIADHRKAVYGTILGAAAAYGVYKGYTTKESYINRLLTPTVTLLKPTVTAVQNYLSNVDWQSVNLYGFVAVAIGLPIAIGKKVDNINTNPIAAE